MESAKRRAVYWLSTVPEKCETCEAAITNIFYDAKTRTGPWALMCTSCFHIGPGLGKTGVGLGQKYEKQLDGKWLKVE